MTISKAKNAGICFFILAVAACAPLEDRELRTNGAGAELYSSSTSEATQNLKLYFGALCEQAELTTTKDTSSRPLCDTRNLNKSEWKELVHTGYNDIDLRCDRYLSWIDEKRREREFFERGTTAATTLASGLLALIAPETQILNFIGIGLGFTKSTYDAYHNLILLGLERSTIKTIVMTRRLQHRQKFKNANYTQKSDAVFALRAYLSICTPLSITLDVNEYSRAGVTGETPTGEKTLELQSNVLINPLEPPPAGGSGKPTPTVGEAAKIFENSNYDDKELKDFQTRSCVKVDGDAGPETLAAVKILESHLYYGDDSKKSERISTEEWARFQEISVACVDRARFRNFFENTSFGQYHDPATKADRNTAARTSERGIIKRLADNFPGALATYNDDLTLGDPAVRAAIKAARTRFIAENKVKDLGPRTEAIITEDLFRELGKL